MEIVIIGKLWPEPNSSAAGKRMMQLIELLKPIGNVTFACPAQKTGYESELSIDSVEIQLNNDAFDGFIRGKSPGIVVFDRFMTEEQFGWRVMEQCPDAIRILNTEDLHFLRKTRGEALKSGVSFENLNFRNHHTMRELASIYRCDLTLLTSDFERGLLVNTFGIPPELVAYLPIFSDGIQDNCMSFSERSDLVFIGNYLHEPNLDAVIYLKKEIWTLLREKRKGIAVHIYGAYPIQQILDFHNPKDGFFVHGRIDDVQTIIGKARLSLAPLRFGAGIKGKLLESMELGTPSITSPIGAEGIGESNNWPGKIATNPMEFVDAIIELYDNEQLWSINQKKGAELLESKFNKNNYQALFEMHMQDLIENVQQHRNKLITSQIIQHQSLLATKYLSKWIMEKQKSK